LIVPNTRDRYIERLKQKQAKVRVIQQATQIVMDTRGVSEEEAYQMLRAQAMLKREPIETVAGEIVKARETLRF
jgi:AmiR/NasT family two-component response regulator